MLRLVRALRAALFAVVVCGAVGACSSGPKITKIEDDRGPAVDCSAYMPLATPSELALSPRSRPDLEQLAISMRGTFLADPALYDLLEGDLGRMAKDDARLGLRHRAGYPGDRLVLIPDDDTRAAIAAGTYLDWACLNRAYGASATVESSFVVLSIAAIVDVPALAAEYEALPGIKSASPSIMMGDGPTLCATEDGASRHYLFDFASGDCPSGCIDHEYELHTVDAEGKSALTKQWSNAKRTRKPAWVKTYSCPR